MNYQVGLCDTMCDIRKTSIHIVLITVYFILLQTALETQIYHKCKNRKFSGFQDKTVQ